MCAAQSRMRHVDDGRVGQRYAFAGHCFRTAREGLEYAARAPRCIRVSEVDTNELEMEVGPKHLLQRKVAV
jgi:hypothetical protein